METNIYRLDNVYLEKKDKSGITHILNEINLSINQGDFVCIMGPTGCGKSSLLKLLGTTELPSKGIVSFKGKNTSDKKAIPTNMLRQLGIAFQSDNLFEGKTVEKNISIPIDIFKLKKELDSKRQIEKMLNLTGLEKYRSCYPHELSGGMRQRCAFARALVHNPQVLLLDQPFGALDAITRKILGIELLKIWKEQNKTIVMVTNSVSEALLLSQRVITLSSAPGIITHEIINTISYEERFKDLSLNEEYVKLSNQINSFVHKKEKVL